MTYSLIGLGIVALLVYSWVTSGWVISRDRNELTYYLTKDGDWTFDWDRAHHFRRRRDAREVMERLQQERPELTHMKVEKW